jgi:hypothetical protein
MGALMLLVACVACRAEAKPGTPTLNPNVYNAEQQGYELGLTDCENHRPERHPSATQPEAGIDLVTWSFFISGYYEGYERFCN